MRLPVGKGFDAWESYSKRMGFSHQGHKSVDQAIYNNHLGGYFSARHLYPSDKTNNISLGPEKEFIQISIEDDMSV